MTVFDILSVLRNCTVNFIYASNESHIATASVFFYCSGTSVNFCDIHIDLSKLYSLSVIDIYSKGPGLINIYVG